MRKKTNLSLAIPSEGISKINEKVVNDNYKKKITFIGGNFLLKNHYKCHQKKM